MWERFLMMAHLKSFIQFSLMCDLGCNEYTETKQSIFSPCSHLSRTVFNSVIPAIVMSVHRSYIYSGRTKWSIDRMK